MESITATQQIKRNALPSTSTMVSIAVSVAIACIGAGLLIGKKTIAGSVLAGVGSIAFGLTVRSAHQTILGIKMRRELKSFLTSLRDEFKEKEIKIKVQYPQFPKSQKYLRRIEGTIEKIRGLTDEEIERLVSSADLSDIVLILTPGKERAEYINAMARIFGDDSEKFDDVSLMDAILNSKKRNELVFKLTR